MSRSQSPNPDSTQNNVVIAAGRRGNTVEQLIEEIVKVTGDQEAALSAIGLTELVQGIYRAQTQAVRLRCKLFITASCAPFTFPRCAGIYQRPDFAGHKMSLGSQTS